MPVDAVVAISRRFVVPVCGTCATPTMPWGCRVCRDRQRKVEAAEGRVLLRAFEPDRTKIRRERRPGNFVVDPDQGGDWADFEESAQGD